MPKRDQEVSFGYAPINTITPSTTSTIQMAAAITKANGIRNSILSTAEEKYSSSLYEKPKASFALINPEIINKIPTSNLEVRVKKCISIQFY
jgi:hypothetical protein